MHRLRNTNLVSYDVITSICIVLQYDAVTHQYAVCDDVRVPTYIKIRRRVWIWFDTANMQKVLYVIFPSVLFFVKMCMLLVVWTGDVLRRAEGEAGAGNRGPQGGAHYPVWRSPASGIRVFQHVFEARIHCCVGYRARSATVKCCKFDFVVIRIRDTFFAYYAKKIDWFSNRARQKISR